MTPSRRTTRVRLAELDDMLAPCWSCSGADCTARWYSPLPSPGLVVRLGGRRAGGFEEETLWWSFGE
jgi:hypothetical protein